jgi:plasmid stabilization system protein ParE
MLPKRNEAFFTPSTQDKTLKLIRKAHFIASLKSILEFIAQDKPSAALDFFSQLDRQLLTLLESPYMYRKSHYFTEECYRDFIFKGYTVIYKVDSNTVYVLEIFKWKKR